MKTYTKIVREGELLGPIDWKYDFLQHFKNYGCSDAEKVKMCERVKELLKQVEANPSHWKVNINGYWHKLIDVGMYDGWPYWQPTPALFVSGTLGGEWQFFYSLQEVEPIKD